MTFSTVAQTVPEESVNCVATVDRSLSFQGVPNCSKLFVRYDESCMKRFPAGFLKFDAGRFVPNYIIFPKPMNQHQHVERIDRAVDAASENGSDVVAGAPRERQIKPHLALIFGDELQPPAGPAIAGKEIKRLATKFVGNEGAQGRSRVRI